MHIQGGGILTIGYMAGVNPDSDSQPFPRREPPASKTPASSPQPTSMSTPNLNADQPDFIPPTIDEIPLDEVTSLAAFQGNKATGESTPDFSANLMRGGTFTLSDRRNSFLMLIPTVVGCGPCMFHLHNNLGVLVLDIFTPPLRGVSIVCRLIPAGVVFMGGGRFDGFSAESQPDGDERCFVGRPR